MEAGDEPYDFLTWHSNVPELKDEKKEMKKEVQKKFSPMGGERLSISAKELESQVLVCTHRHFQLHFGSFE